MNIRHPILEEDIWNAVALAPGHPVFKIEGFGEGSFVDALVIKLEAHKNDANVAFAARMMTLVDSNARTHVLKPDEITALKTWCGFGGLGDIRMVPAANELKTMLGIPGAWVKMEVKRLVMLDSAIDKRLKGDKADVRWIARALKHRGGLEKVGEIVAADFFNGNEDRFCWPPPGVPVPGGTIRFQTIQNVGNVFFACGANGSGVPIGLDSFDPNSQQRYLHVAVDESTWMGRILKPVNGAYRKTFAKNLVSDLEIALGPRNRKNPFAKTHRLGSHRRRRILTGIANGENIMKRYLVNWRNSGQTIPVGIASKMTILSW